MLAGLRKTSILGAVAMSAFTAFAIFQGCTDGAPPGGSSKIVVTAAATNLDAPIDAAPDPNNENIWFLAKGLKGVALFKMPASGGEPTEVFSGEPFAEPQGVALNPDGTHVFVTDRAAEGGRGAIFAIPVGGGAPVVVKGTEGTHPGALDLADVRGDAMIYFTGTVAGGKPAVYSISSEGGKAAVLASGEPFGKPSGVAAAMDGSVFVTDEAPPSGGQGAIFHVSAGQVSSLASGFVAGHPAGTALTMDESVLLISTLDEAQGTAQVLIVDVKTAKTTTFSERLRSDRAAGGLHRSFNNNAFAMMGSQPMYALLIKRIQFEGSTPGGPSN